MIRSDLMMSWKSFRCCCACEFPFLHLQIWKEGTAFGWLVSHEGLLWSVFRCISKDVTLRYTLRCVVAVWFSGCFVNVSAQTQGSFLAFWVWAGHGSEETKSAHSVGDFLRHCDGARTCPGNSQPGIAACRSCRAASADRWFWCSGWDGCGSAIDGRRLFGGLSPGWLHRAVEHEDQWCLPAYVRSKLRWMLHHECVGRSFGGLLASGPYAQWPVQSCPFRDEERWSWPHVEDDPAPH